MKILVTGAGIIYALPVIRMLGRLGHEVTAASSHVRANGFYSRFTKARWVYPEIGGNAGDFENALVTFLKNNPQDFVFPLFEETLPLSRMQARLEGLAKISVGNYSDLLRFHDKSRLHRFAGDCGIPVPKTICLPQTIPEGFPFPAFIKAPQSSGSRGVMEVREAAEIPAARDSLRSRGALPAEVEPLLQEKIDGETISVIAYAWQGRPKGILVYRNIGQYPVRGGIGMIRESVDFPKIVSHTKTLLIQSQWHGPAGFDFVVGRKNDTPYLIDANPRLTPGVTLAARCGLNLPAMMASGCEPTEMGKISIGIRSLSEPVALRWFKEVLPGGSLGLGECLSILGKFPASKSEMFDWGDAPSLRALPAILYDLARSALGKDVRGVDRIRSFQFTDYSAGSPKDLKGALTPFTGH